MNKGNGDTILANDQLSVPERLYELIHYIGGRLAEMVAPKRLYSHRLIIELKRMLESLDRAMAALEAQMQGPEPLSPRLAQDIKWQIAAHKVRLQDELKKIGHDIVHVKKLSHALRRAHPEDSYDLSEPTAVKD